MEGHIIGFFISLAVTLIGLLVEYFVIQPRRRQQNIIPYQENPQNPRRGRQGRGFSSIFRVTGSTRVSRAYKFVLVIVFGGAAGGTIAALLALDSPDSLPFLLISSIIGGIVLAVFFDSLFGLSDDNLLLRLPLAIFWGAAGGFLAPLLLCGGILIFGYKFLFGSDIPASPKNFVLPKESDFYTTKKETKRKEGFFIGCPECDKYQGPIMGP